MTCATLLFTACARWPNERLEHTSHLVLRPMALEYPQLLVACPNSSSSLLGAGHTTQRSRRRRRLGRPPTTWRWQRPHQAVPPPGVWRLSSRTAGPAAAGCPRRSSRRQQRQRRRPPPSRASGGAPCAPTTTPAARRSSSIAQCVAARSLEAGGTQASLSFDPLEMRAAVKCLAGSTGQSSCAAGWLRSSRPIAQVAQDGTAG